MTAGVGKPSFPGLGSQVLVWVPWGQKKEALALLGMHLKNEVCALSRLKAGDWVSSLEYHRDPQAVSEGLLTVVLSHLLNICFNSF